MNAAIFRRVLVGWDGSDGAGAALRIAATIADSDGAEVAALAVLSPILHIETERDRTAEESRRRGLVEESFGNYRNTLPATCNAKISLHFSENFDVGRAVCEYADANNFDLIILGRHGKRWAHDRLGNVVETVAKKSSIPLLLLEGQA